jgi:ATP-binding cassette subfamily G (WHITE) protein 2
VWLQALLGPSGAGKSSLLDILACRKATGSISGSLLINGRAVQRAAYSRRIAYVPQVMISPYQSMVAHALYTNVQEGTSSL